MQVRALAGFTPSVRCCVASALLSFLVAITASAAEPRVTYFDGKVVGVIDGDTIDVLVGKTVRRVRLSGIDTPESGQPWASRSKAALSARVFGREVRVNEVATDSYGRTVGEVYANDVCVGCELVREGHAWVYGKYSDDAVLLELESDARAQRRGLWGLPEADRVPPWEWRHRGPDHRSTAPTAAPVFQCGVKTYCREMASCSEAKFYLRECGLTRLDGDHDGVPCEVLCGDAKRH